MKMQHFLGLSSLALLLLLPPLGWAQRTFHTPGGNITPGSEGQGSQNAPRGQNIRPASDSGSTSAGGIRPAGSSTSAGSTTGGTSTSRSPSTIHTPGGNITPGSEGQGSQNAPRGQNIRPASGSAGSTTGSPAPGGSITPGSQDTGQANQNVRDRTIRFPQGEYIGEHRTREPARVTSPTKGTSSIGPGISGEVRGRTEVTPPPARAPEPKSRSVIFGGERREYTGEHRGPGARIPEPTRSSTKGTSSIGPGISGEVRGRTEVTPPPARAPEPKSRSVIFGGERREYTGEHRGPGAVIPESTRSSTKGTSRIGQGISTGPVGRQTINVGGPQGVTGSSPKTGVTVGVPGGSIKSIGIEPGPGGPAPGSSQAMPVGRTPGGPGMQAPAPSGVSVPIEAPPPLKVPSIEVP